MKLKTLKDLEGGRKYTDCAGEEIREEAKRWRDELEKELKDLKEIIKKNKLSFENNPEDLYVRCMTLQIEISSRIIFINTFFNLKKEANEK